MIGSLPIAMRHFRRGLYGSLCGLLAGACIEGYPLGGPGFRTPEGLAEPYGMFFAFIDVAFDCSCDGTGAESGHPESAYVDGHPASIDELFAIITSWYDGVLGAGLEFNAECAGVLATRTWPDEAVGCALGSSGQLLDCADECGLFYGSAPAGSACTWYGRRMSDCQRDLICGVDEVCHVPCEAPMIGAEGALCAFDSGVVGIDCDLGLVCSGGRCVTGGVEGSPCDASLPCGSPWSCVEGVCSAGKSPGALCASDEECVSKKCVEALCIDELPNYCLEWSW